MGYVSFREGSCFSHDSEIGEGKVSPFVFFFETSWTQIHSLKTNEYPLKINEYFS